MSWLSSFFGKKTNQKKQRPERKESTKYTLRQGKSVPVDDAFQAWTSGNLKQMLKAVSTKTNPIAGPRHLTPQVSERVRF